MRPPTALFPCFSLAWRSARSGAPTAACTRPDDGGPGSAGAAGTAGRGGARRGRPGRRGGSGGSGGSGGAATGAAGRRRRRRHGRRPAPATSRAGGGCRRRRLRRDVQLRERHAWRGHQRRLHRLYEHHDGRGRSTFCGSGALAITALFSGTSGTTTKGEVLINLPGAPLDLTGKTITVHVAADPGCSTDLNLSLVLNTQSGPVYFTPAFPIRPVTNIWKTGTAMVTAVAGSTTALAISLQAFSSTNYTGTIYVDEIDIR